MDEEIKGILFQGISDHVFPGVVVGIFDKLKGKSVIAMGNFTYDTSSPEVKEETIFDVASITKTIPTSSLALYLVDRGKLGLGDLVVQYLPELKCTYSNEITIWHLLTQTLDIDLKLSELKSESPQMILRAIFNARLKSKPGSNFWYTNATSVLLGLVVERVFGNKLPDLAESIFFGPLGMTRTSFKPLMKFGMDEIAPTEMDDWREGVIQGVVHDESAYTLQKLITPGSAGLFTTAEDLLRYAEMLLGGGEYLGRRYFSENILAQMNSNQLDQIGKSNGLGWELNSHAYMGAKFPDHTFGKSGFTGCTLVMNAQLGRAVVLLSNSKYPKRRDNIGELNQIRCAVADLVWNQ